MNPESYCIPLRHRFLGLTTKQLWNNFEPQKPGKYKQFWRLTPDPSWLQRKVYFISLFRGVIVSLSESSFFLVNNDWGSCFLLVYYDWWCCYFRVFNIHLYIGTQWKHNLRMWYYWSSTQKNLTAAICWGDIH